MAVISLGQFLGERPGRHPQKLEGYEAQVARNARLVSRSLEPFYGRADSANTSAGLTPRTIFKDRNNVWLEFAEKVNVVNSIVGNDPHDRVFFTSSIGPRVSNGALRMSGPGPYPGASLILGVPALTDPPGLTVPLGLEGDAVDPDTGLANAKLSRVYTVTLQNSYGEEGPPSPASAVISVFPGATVRLTLPDAPGGAYVFVEYNIYRFIDGAYQYVGSAPIASTTFDDDLHPDLAQEPLESTSWTPPPGTLKGLVSVAGSFLAGHRDNQVLFSEDGLPHAWPTEYRQGIDHTVVGLGSYGSTVVVATNGPVYVGMGAVPSSILVTETGVNQACVAAESIVSMAGGVAFASPDGLVFVSDAGIKLATVGVMTEREWRALNPATIRATSWNSIYVASYVGTAGVGAFMFDPQAPDVGIIWLDLPRASALFTHVETDKMYMVDQAGTKIVEWDANALTTFAPFRWRSRPHDVPAPIPINVVQVKADAYPIIVRVFADGVEQSETEVSGIRPVRVAGGRLGRSYAFEIEGAGRTYEMLAATTMVELRQL